MAVERFYSTGESARFLKISVSTLQRLRRSGKLVPERFGKNNSVFYSEGQLRRFRDKAVVVGTSGVATQSVVDNSGCVVGSGAMVRLVDILPIQYFSGVTKLMKKLQVVEIGQGFKTSFDSSGKLYTFARLDYADEKVSFSGRFDAADELILNAIYSITRSAHADNDGNYAVGSKPMFSSRRILQHIFGNVADHFQDEIVEFVEKRLERLSWMKLTFDLRDSLGNSQSVVVRGVRYRPAALRENLLDMSVVDFENETRERRFPVYKLHRKSPIFMYAEKLNQVTSWSAHYMAVPCRKTIQNALIAIYFLTRFSLIKNKSNHYLNTGVLFETFFEDLGLDVTTRKKKKIIRDTVKIMFDYWQKVGLIISYGFMKNWIHPKLRVGAGYKKIVPSDRMIIPTGAESYVARAVDPKNKMPKLKAGKSSIFNLEVLKSSEQNIVVVEGEFDALSVIEAGNDAIALGTTTNVDKLLSWLKESGVRPKKPLVIDLYIR